METPISDIKNNIHNHNFPMAVIGLGRIGLPTAALFANSGAKVIGVDINENIVNLLNDGKTILDEPGLDNLIKKVVKSKNLTATTNINEALDISKILILCLPTPITEGKYPDYSIIRNVCKEIADCLKGDLLIIIESTIAPGTIDNIIIPELNKNKQFKCGKDFLIASCPERADPGSILKIFQNTPRVIGGINEKALKITKEIYSTVVKEKIYEMSNPKTANAVKLTENVFRDVNIALMNEFAILYEKLGIDIYEVIEAASSKWNFIPHYPGAGVGGPCLPANPYYLIEDGLKVGYVPHLVRMAREINDRMPSHMIELILTTLNEINISVKNSKIGVLGIAYKPNVKDFQLSPSIPIIKELKNLGANIQIYDPLFKNEKFLGISIKNDFKEIFESSDCIIIVTDHDEFKTLDLDLLNKNRKKPLVIVDGRNTFNNIIPPGIIYRCIGRNLIKT